MVKKGKEVSLTGDKEVKTMNLEVEVDIYEKRFERLISLTKELWPERKDWKFSEDKEERWQNLLECWNEMNGNVMLGAMHHIHWGFYPDKLYSEKEVELMKLIEYEIKSHGEAFKEWFSDCRVLANFWDIICQMKSYGTVEQKSTEHFKAMSTFTNREVLWADPEFNPDALKEAYLYKDFLFKLIPDVMFWSKEQLMNDENIFVALEEKYGLDLRVAAPADPQMWSDEKIRYDWLFKFYKALKIGDSDEAKRALLRIPTFTKAMLHNLCDGYEEEFMLEAYLKAYRNAELNKERSFINKPCGTLYRDIKKSCLHRYLKDCVLSEEMPQIRKVIFDVELRG